MRQSKKISIQNLLILSFALCMTLVLTLTLIIFSVWQYRTLKKESISALNDSTVSIGNSIDKEISQMNTITLNAIGATSLRQTFNDYWESASGDSESDTIQHIESRRTLANILTAVKGFDFSIRQLNIYGNEDYGYGAGAYNGEIPFPAYAQPWYEETLAQNGRLFICNPAVDIFLSQESNTSEDTLYFSVTRVFYDLLRRQAGFIEVKKFYNVVFRSAMKQPESYSSTIVVYSEAGRQLYPAKNASDSDSDQTFSYFAYKDNGNGEIYNTERKQKEYVSFYTTEDNHLVIAQALDTTKFMAPVYQSLRWVLALYILLFLFCIVLSSFLSDKFSLPIKHIYHFLNRTTDNEFPTLDMADTGVREIDKLRDSLNENIKNTEAVTATMMTLKEQEVQAQMLALQSQMNPHFLYNSLSTIAEMAAEGLNEQVADMCTDITEILRYISSNREQTTSIEEEMELCALYLNCMRMRYPTELSYRFDIDDQMLDLQIPKLCIQMLIENAMKYATAGSPPWNIHVHGYIQNNSWFITVHDNGPGFDAEVDKTLRLQMDEILKTGVLPSLQIRGMGILNIFIRFYLLYGIPFEFQFGSQPEGGGFVTVGAPLSVEK
ncbi:MAG: histidine kinase [Eubacteriales bacterium]|nr:histidine kinase [Eubacteriales bacterium]